MQSVTHKLLMAVAASAFASLVAGGCFAAKTDIITLDNGSTIIGEIKKLQRGLLEVSTDNMSTIQIEWETVVGVLTHNNYTVETENGTRTFGSIENSENKHHLMIRVGDHTKEFEISDIVGIQRIKDSFVSRWDGSVSLGTSAIKANNEVTLVATLDASYRTRRNFYNINTYSSFFRRDDSATTERHNIDLNHSAFIVNRWYSLAAADLEHNTELDLKLRTLISGGVRYQVVNNTRNRLLLSTGLTLNNEQYFISILNQVSAEAFVGFSHDYFKFRTPKADLKTRMTVFPSLTESNRYRTLFDTAISWEMVKDFWLDLSLYYIADSNPPSQNSTPGSQTGSGNSSENPNGTDWGFNTSLRFKF